MSKNYLKKGETLKNERTNLVNKNKYGSLMKVIEYNNAKDIFVQFEKGKLVHTNWEAFRKGRVTNPYDITVYGVGYIGEGNHKVGENGKHSPQYKIWNSMMQRGYDPKRKEKYPSYKDVSVCLEWHCFNTFANWYDENFYKIEGEKICLDKDILMKGNKIYSPDACIFVPTSINSLFTKNNSMRGNLPIGVHYHKKYNKYISYCSNGNKLVYLGNYEAPEEAFFAYKIHKEKYIKEKADEYKDKIPAKLYDAMITYEVEIND